MFKDLTDSLHQITDRIEDLGTSTLEYYKLRLFKSSTKAAISLVNLLVYGSLSLFVLVFLSVGAALWLGTLFEAAFVGFLLIGAFYGLCLIFMFIYGRKLIEHGMLKTFSGLVYDEDDLEPKEVAREEVAEFSALINEEIQADPSPIELENLPDENLLVEEEEILDDEDLASRKL